MKPDVNARAIVALIFSLMLWGCGGGTQQVAQAPQASAAPTPSSQAQIKVSISPGLITLGASETQQFTASVTNSANTVVTWSLECTAVDCGTISATGLYTAPAVIPDADMVWVLARPQADQAIRYAAVVSYMPLAVELSPPAVEMAAGATRDFTASVTRHSNHDVTWTLSGLGCRGSACGTLTNASAASATYTAPAIITSASTALVKATSVADPTKSQTVRINLMPVTAPLNGQYALLFRASDSATVFAASLVADGKGNLSGTGDLVNGSGVHANLPFAGTYTLGGDGRGTMQITGAGATLKLSLVMESGDFGRLLDFCGASDGDGWLEKQNESAFSSAALAGKYAYLLAGKRAGTEASVSHVGWVAFDSGCKIVGNYSTMNEPAVKGMFVGGSLGWGTIDAGYCTVDANTGRGTLTATERWLATLPDIFFYIIDANRAVLLGDASGSLRLSGAMERMTKTQYKAADFRGDYTYYVVSDAAIAAGRFSAGAGLNAATTALSSGIEDRVEDSKVTLDTPVTGVISNSWCYPNCGYGDSDFGITMTTADLPLSETYLAPISPGKFYFIGVGYYGEAYAQGGGPFSSNTFAGNFGLQFFGRDAHAVGVATVAPPDVTGQADVSNNGLASGASAEGTISFVSDDRANVSLSTGATGTLPFRAYVISPKKLLLISTLPGQVTMGWLEKEE